MSHLSAGDWILGYVPHYDRHGEENGVEPTSWLVGRISEVEPATFATSNRPQRRLVHFDMHISSYLPELAWVRGGFNIRSYNVVRKFDDEAEALHCGEILKRSSFCHRLLGDYTMEEAMNAVCSMASRREYDRAENVVREQEALVERLNDPIKTFHAKLKLLCETEDLDLSR